HLSLRSFPTRRSSDLNEASRGCAIRNLNLVLIAESFHNQIDGTVVQMETLAIGQPANLCRRSHSAPLVPFAGCSGQGFSGWATRDRKSTRLNSSHDQI